MQDRLAKIVEYRNAGLLFAVVGAKLKAVWQKLSLVASHSESGSAREEQDTMENQEQVLNEALVKARAARDKTRLDANLAKERWTELKTRPKPADRQELGLLKQQITEANNEFLTLAKRAHNAMKAAKKAENDIERFVRTSSGEKTSSGADQSDATAKVRDGAEEQFLRDQTLREVGEKVRTELPKVTDPLATVPGNAPDRAVNNAVEKALAAEIRQNLGIARTPWTGKPLEFQTAAWEKGISFLDEAQQASLREAYADIQLANNIVWLVNQTGLGGSEIEDGYRLLCDKIAQRLAVVFEPQA